MVAEELHPVLGAYRVRASYSTCVVRGRGPLAVARLFLERLPLFEWVDLVAVGREMGVECRIELWAWYGLAPWPAVVYDYSVLAMRRVAARGSVRRVVNAVERILEERGIRGVAVLGSDVARAVLGYGRRGGVVLVAREAGGGDDARSPRAVYGELREAVRRASSRVLRAVRAVEGALGKKRR